MASRHSTALIGLCAALVAGALACGGDPAGKVKDEALAAGRSVESFPPSADPDYFRDMDSGYPPGAEPLSKSENIGRNMWHVWTGGNDRFWDWMSGHTFGAFDLLKTLSSHPDMAYGRYNRWSYLGLVNEPCFEQASEPDEYGLWLDRRSPDCPPDPFDDPVKHPGVQVGARGTTAEVGSFYGKPTGVLGLRLFPNPSFDDKARKYWMDHLGEFYTNPDFYDDTDLVRPYRVGMACSFCHVGPNPVNPPPDPENPGFQHLNSNPGAQYYWVDRVFVWDTEPRASEREHYGSKARSYAVQRDGEAYAEPQADSYAAQDKPAKQESNFIYQLFHTNPPGALDTSLVSTDYINNPRTMNAVYSLASRLGPAARWGKEQLAGGELDNKQFQDFERTKSLSAFYDDSSHTVHTARVLKDGSDAAGVLGALNRVYLNIGLFSEEWTAHFRPVIGGKMISPIKIADAQRNSTYWNVTERDTPDMALFFLKTAKPDRLEDVPGAGERYVNLDPQIQANGRRVFAENCAACHSSKIPPAPPGVEDDICEGGGNGPHYLECWNRYWDWAQTGDFKRQMRELVDSEEFREGNFLSTEKRVPVTLLETNICSALATNAIEGSIWDNFSSQSYKALPSVGTVKLQHPITGREYDYEMPAGGRGYTRPASLISLWSTAPFLQNNSVGTFYTSPSVEARMASFDDSIEKMLWPERRVTDAQKMRELGLPPERAIQAPGYIYRTTAPSCLSLAPGYLPGPLAKLSEQSFLSRLLPWIFSDDGGVAFGPIPKGTPVNLLANLELKLDPGEDGSAEHSAKLLRLLLELKRDLKAVGGGCGDDLEDQAKLERARSVYLDESDVVDRMLELSKCPDFVVNRGHYFGRYLEANDKRDLIEFLKTF